MTLVSSGTAGALVRVERIRKVDRPRRRVTGSAVPRPRSRNRKRAAR